MSSIHAPGRFIGFSKSEGFFGESWAFFQCWSPWRFALALSVEELGDELFFSGLDEVFERALWPGSIDGLHELVGDTLFERFGTPFEAEPFCWVKECSPAASLLEEDCEKLLGRISAPSFDGKRCLDSCSS